MKSIEYLHIYNIACCILPDHQTAVAQPESYAIFPDLCVYMLE